VVADHQVRAPQTWSISAILMLRYLLVAIWVCAVGGWGRAGGTVGPRTYRAGLPGLVAPSSAGS